MKRWPFVALAVTSFTVSGLIAMNEVSSAASPVDGSVVVATMPPALPPEPKLVLPRNGLFAMDAVAQAEGIQPSPLPLPVLEQNEAQAWAATAVSGVTAVSVAGDSAYAVIQTSSGSLIVRLGDMVDGRKVIGITDCDPPEPGCRPGVMFEGGVFEPVGVKSTAQVPAISGFPAKAVPVQALPGAPATPGVAAGSVAPQIAPTDSNGSGTKVIPYRARINRNVTTMPTPSVIDPNQQPQQQVIDPNQPTPQTPEPK